MPRNQLERMEIDSSILAKLLGYPDGSEVKTVMRVPRAGGPPGSADFVFCVEVPADHSPRERVDAHGSRA